MLSVKGLFQDGVARPYEHVSGSDGRPVIIAFLDEEVISLSPSERDKAWDTLAQLMEECAVETGVADLAQQHDHYLCSKPKRG